MFSGVNLSSAQSIEMDCIVRQIQTDPIAKSELQAVLSQFKDPNSKALLESIWKEDTTTSLSDERRQGSS